MSNYYCVAVVILLPAAGRTCWTPAGRPGLKRPEGPEGSGDTPRASGQRKPVSTQTAGRGGSSRGEKIAASNAGNRYDAARRPSSLTRAIPKNIWR